MAVHVWPQTPWRQKQPSSHDCVAEMAVGFVGPLSLDASRGELSRLHLGRHAAATKSHPLLRKLLNISERFCATRCKMPTNWPLFNPYVRCFVYSVSQGSARSRAFYAKAKKNLWLQAATLCGTGAAGLTVTAIKQLIPAGRRTPVFPFTAQVMCVRVDFIPSTCYGTGWPCESAGAWKIWHMVELEVVKAFRSVLQLPLTVRLSSSQHHHAHPTTAFRILFACVCLSDTVCTRDCGRVYSGNEGSGGMPARWSGRVEFRSANNGKSFSSSFERRGVLVRLAAAHEADTIVEAKGKVLPDEKLETRWIRHDTSEDDHAQPAAIKSGAGGKTGAQQNSRKSGTARVMPTQDNLYVVDVDEEGIAGAGHWGWMDASVDNTRGRAPPPSLPPLLPTSPGGRVRLSPIEVIHAWWGKVQRQAAPKCIQVDIYLNQWGLVAPKTYLGLATPKPPTYAQRVIHPTLATCRSLGRGWEIPCQPQPPPNAPPTSTKRMLSYV